MTLTRRTALGAAFAASLLGGAALAQAPTEIELFFPVPVDGQLARDMNAMIKEFNDKHPAIKATAVFTGSYDETLIKTRAAMKAGKPPAAVIMSANFITDLKIENEVSSLDALIAKDGSTNEKFMGQFWPALRGNAVLDGSVYAVPFHNSTPLLYINADHFKEAGLDPKKPPQTWGELVETAKKLTKREGDKVTRWGLSIPGNYDYLGWMVTALTMSNGGRYYNEDFAGEVYYDTPSMLGAVTFWNDLIQKHKVTPGGVVAGPAVTTSFLAGQSAMMLLSTGSLTHVLNNAKFPVEVGFVPKNVRNAVAIGGASLIIPAGVEGARRDAAWTMIKWMTGPEKSGWWSRATGYFAPNMAAYDTAEMKEYLAKRPQAQVAVNQLVHARPWFATFKTVPVRKALEDEVQAVLSGKKAPKEALAAAQKAADEILAPFNKETSLRNF
ncbi:MAG: ABC transporter substrate-binding protein [Hyphomicrobiales bacterium]|nr:ABC transporter substrate-binding protein [Hyphomicrobiales bacterium]